MLSEIPKKSVFLLLFILVAIFLFYEFWPRKAVTTEEKNNKIEQVLGRTPKLEAADLSLGKTFEGEYFSLQYPSAMQIYDKLPIDKNGIVVESFRADSMDPRITFTAQVLAPQDLVVGDFSAVTLRRSKKDIYKESEITVDGQKAIYFEKNFLEEGQQYPFEADAFIVKGSNLYTFVFSSKDLENGKSVFSDILATVKIK